MLFIGWLNTLASAWLTCPSKIFCLRQSRTATSTLAIAPRTDSNGDTAHLPCIEIPAKRRRGMAGEMFCAAIYARQYRRRDRWGSIRRFGHFNSCRSRYRETSPGAALVRNCNSTLSGRISACRCLGSSWPFERRSRPGGQDGE